MKKVLITERNNINENLLAKHVILVNDPNEADFILSQSTIRYTNLLHKTIYLAIEPPRTDHRMWCYSNFDSMHTVFCHNPDPNKENQFPFNPDDAAQFYPTNADPYPFRTRSDTSMRNKGVFYAGMINWFERGPDACGGINITPLRKVLGEYFKKQFPDSQIIGIGWEGQKTKVGNWREDKLIQLDTSPCDFVLALENTIYPNYLYEKIWDGFIADRVTLYLGDPRVEHHIPLNCFVDLRPWFHLPSKDFDVEGLGDYLRKMTQQEYDSIIKNMRNFREKAKGKHRHYMDLLTMKIVERINGG